MEFEIAKRKFGIRVDHLLVFAPVLFILLVLSILFGIAYSFVVAKHLPEADFITVLISMSTTGLGILVLVSPPIEAFLLLWAAGFFNMKKDVALCRSLSAAQFIIAAILFLVLFVLSISVSFLGLSDSLSDVPSLLVKAAPMLLQTIINIASNSFILYLWLLIFVKPDTGKLKKTAEQSLIFSVAALISIMALASVISYGSDFVYLLPSLPGTVALLASYFLLGFAVLYNIRGSKLDKSAYLFAGLYLGSEFIYMLVLIADKGLSGFAYRGISELADLLPSMLFVGRVIELVLLYLLSGAKFE